MSVTATIPAQPADASPDYATQLAPDLKPIALMIAQRQTGPARVRLNNHLKLHPQDSQAEFLFGWSYHREQKYAQARPYYESALSRTPAYVVANHFLGWALYYLGDLEPARAAFERHLQHQPDEGDSHFGLGLIDLDEDRLDEAEARFRRAIELFTLEGDNPKGLSKARTRLGEAYERRDELDKARTELELATALYPDHYEAWYKLYRVLERLGEAEAAEQAHRDYLASKERVRPGTSFPE